jgi:hypothetical protein
MLAVDAALALTATLLDTVSTAWFVVPSKALFGDPGRFERGLMPRKLMRRFGIGFGLTVNGIFLFLLWFFLIGFSDVSSPEIGSSTPYLLISGFVLCWNSFVCGNNYQVGRQLRSRQQK